MSIDKETPHNKPSTDISELMSKVLEKGSDLFKELADKGMNLIQQKKVQEVLEEFQKELDNPLKVAVVGGSGVGKSTLINSIFGTNLKTSSDSKGCTTEFEWITTEKTIHVLDCPGIGDATPENDEKYREGYQEHLPEADLIIVVDQMGRNYSSLRDTIDSIPEDLRFIVVLTQPDKLLNSKKGIGKHWELDPYQPKDELRKKIESQREACSEAIKIPSTKILAVSSLVEEDDDEPLHWGHSAVVDKLIQNAKSAIVKAQTVKKAKEENVSEKAKANAESGVIDWVMDKVGDVVEAVGDFATKAAISKVVSWLARRWFVK
ncbi:TPA: GTPase RsgA [Vibrio parahaemolyticus]|nr:GTPase RsgA [Vibrio parahaemolyticus]HAV1348636.1 GTPase RsgA [Vibrio parahaemolyticus]HBN6086972.1 50S ribosome-binding GTPase [Vibrio parahaemolyticus]HBN6195535.1 50S ribosome-binding GTPase [Vibrio parahaemolyticus]